MREPYNTLFKNIDFAQDSFYKFEQDFPNETILQNRIQRLKEMISSQTEILRQLVKDSEKL